MKEIIHCQYCGTKINPESNFCEGCGEQLNEEEEYEEDYEARKFSDIIPEYPKRFLEIFIILNIISIMWSVYINWGYFYYLRNWINVVVTCGISLGNIFFLFNLYKGKIKYFFWLGILAFIIFILALGGFVHKILLFVSIIELLIFYIILFWAKHPMKY